MNLEKTFLFTTVILLYKRKQKPQQYLKQTHSCIGSPLLFLFQHKHFPFRFFFLQIQTKPEQTKKGKEKSQNPQRYFLSLLARGKKINLKGFLLISLETSFYFPLFSSSRSFVRSSDYYSSIRIDDGVLLRSNGQRLTTPIPFQRPRLNRRDPSVNGLF